MKKYYNFTKRILTIVVEDPRRVYKAGRIFFTQGPFVLFNKLKYQADIFQKINQQYREWLRYNYPTEEILDQQTLRSKKFRYTPLISVICPTYNTPVKFLNECVNSVLNQSYENWELCLVDDASTDERVREVIKNFAKTDKRIKFVFQKQNGHICKASNSALQIAKGEFVALLDHDDFLWPNALFEVVSRLNKNLKLQFIYSDEDKLSEQGKHIDPFFKPDWSPHYLRSVNYITHLAVLRRSLVSKVGNFRPGFEGAQDWDLFLRATNKLKKEEIQHIPEILYSWRKSDQSTSSENAVGKVKLYAYENQKKALEADLKERGFSGSVEESGNIGSWRLRYKIKGKPKVSIIIPTKDKINYISRCLESVLKKTTYKNFEIIIVDTGSKDKRVWDLYQRIKKRWSSMKVLKWTKEFNFSSVCNFGVEKSSGKFIVLLNNDTEVITPDWIEGLLEYAQLPEVGEVGCKLLYPDLTIQHAGIILGITGGSIKKGVAGHAFHFFDDKQDMRAMIQGVRDYSAVTAACVMVKKEKYLEVGGQDSDLKIAFNDVDLGLKLSQQGYYNIYNGFVKLIHHESISVEKPGSENRDLVQFKKEINLMHSRWGELLQNDPFFNKNLSLKEENFTLRN